MIKIFNLSVFLLFILNVFSCQQKIKGPENVPGEDKLAKFQEAISDLVQQLEIEGYSYVITSNKDVLKLIENGLTADQKIQVGDVSAMLLSTLLLQCSEEDLVGSSDYLSQYGITGDPGKAKIKEVLSFTYNTTYSSLNYSTENFHNICQVLKSATKEEVSGLFSSNFGGKLKMKQTAIQENEKEITCVSSLNDLVKFSMAIDNQRLFREENTHSEMFRPVYLETGERSPAGLGCFIDISDDRKIIWSAGQTKEYSAILIKSVTDSLSFIMVAKSDRLNAPFSLHTGEINQTPLYYAFVNTLLSKDSTAATINFKGNYSEIRQSIQKALSSGYRDLAYNQLCAYLKISGYMQDQPRFDSLASVYREFFPNDIRVEKLFVRPVTKISATMDYVRYKRNFSIEKEETVSIFSTAEFAKTMTLQPWEYDNVEIYFDLNNEKSTNFNSGQDDRQYRFNYDFEELTGNAPTFDSITLVQYDISDTRFNFEIAIPWKTLFNSDTIKPGMNKVCGFDIAIADNDGQARQGSLAWHSRLDETPWSNTSYLGNMILAKSPGQIIDSICYAIYSPAPIQLDGQDKGEWANAPRYPIDNEFMSGITGPGDQSGWFRIKWDDNQMYLLVEIQDDVKHLIEKSGDFGWITNSNQDTVWIAKEENTLPAGGNPANRMIRENILLNPGNYTLNYVTNQSHSFGRWVKERPELSFYGIAIYELELGMGGREQGAELAVNSE